MKDSYNPALFDVRDLTRRLQAVGYDADVDSSRVLHWKSEPTPEQITAAQAIVDAYEILSISVDVAQIAADGLTTATVTCNDPLIASDSLLSFAVYSSNREIELAGTIDVASGAVSYPFKTRVKDKYAVELARVSGLENGTVFVEAI